MKALVYENYTLDDDFSKILKIKDIPEPIPKHNEVVFKVKYASLNTTSLCFGIGSGISLIFKILEKSSSRV